MELKSEKLTAYEIGYRIEPTKSLAFDVAAFYNHYDDLATFVHGQIGPEFSPGPFHLVLPLQGQYSASGNSYGVEVQAQWRLTHWWRLMAGYTWFQMRLENADSAEEDSPHHQFQLRSYLDITKDLEFNSALYYVDQTFHSGGITPVANPSYVRLDLGLSWRPTKSLELAIWGQNLLDDRHSEFFSFHTSYLTEVPRSVFGKISWNF